MSVVKETILPPMRRIYPEFSRGRVEDVGGEVERQLAASGVTIKPVKGDPAVQHVERSFS